MSDTDATVLKMPEPKTVAWDDLPQAMQDLLQEQFEIEMRDNFATIRHELLCNFLEQPHIAKEWEEYVEDCFQREMNYSGGEAWDDFLFRKGIT